MGLLMNAMIMMSSQKCKNTSGISVQKSEPLQVATSSIAPQCALRRTRFLQEGQRISVSVHWRWIRR
jgi:hypothetical protein